jgi:hypothetical protein
MAIDLRAIVHNNIYYTNHYLSTVFERNVKEDIFSFKSKKKLTIINLKQLGQC